MRGKPGGVDEGLMVDFVALFVMKKKVRKNNKKEREIEVMGSERIQQTHIHTPEEK